jgi:hypothetical protein
VHIRSVISSLGTSLPKWNNVSRLQYTCLVAANYAILTSYSYYSSKIVLTLRTITDWHQNINTVYKKKPPCTFYTYVWLLAIYCCKRKWSWLKAICGRNMQQRWILSCGEMEVKVCEHQYVLHKLTQVLRGNSTVTVQYVDTKTINKVAEPSGLWRCSLRAATLSFFCKRHGLPY